MPSREDKAIKAKRRHKTRVKAKKQMRNWKASTSNFEKTIGIKQAELSLGHFAKNHALGCGNPKCYICHGDKLLKKKRLQEKRHEQKDKYE